MIKLMTAALLLISAAHPVLGASLSEAKSLYDSNRIGEAEQAFSAVSADTAASREDRSSAERELARIAWLIDGDARKAVKRLERSTAIGGDRCADAIMLARILREAKRGGEALEREPALLAACTEPYRQDGVRTHLIGARVDLAMSRPAGRVALLAAATAEGGRLADRSNVDGARVRLETALLAGDAERAIAAWEDYFWLDEADAPQAMSALNATARFRDGLDGGASAGDRLALAELLMRAGFARGARDFAAVHGLAQAGGDNPVWRKLTAYWRETDAVKAVELRVNRGLARGTRDDAALEKAVKAATIALMQAAGASGDPRQALLEHYGLVGTVGKTSGYPSIHMGHVIEDHADRVTQYGKSADIRFMAIDNMIGNGFESWLWDGSAMVGGWTADGVIVHVRPGYVRSPMRAFRLTYDSEDRRRLIARQAQRAAADLAGLRARAVATTDGLNDRLQLQLVDRIIGAARSRASDEDEAKRLFLAEYSKANLDQSIRVHEGRHAIDNAMGLKDNIDQGVLEYQAKLAELALTAYPRMALINMNRSLEGDGPHDRGGARVFAGFKEWMERHSGEIVGFNPAAPVLTQLDRLTDGQIREIATTLDPLAGGASAANVSANTRSGTPAR